MFKHGEGKKEENKDKKAESKEERRKEKERLKTERKAEREDKKAEKDDRKRPSNTSKSTPKDIPERSLSSPGFGSESPQQRPSSPVGIFSKFKKDHKHEHEQEHQHQHHRSFDEDIVSPRPVQARATVNVEQLTLDKKEELAGSNNNIRRSSLETNNAQPASSHQLSTSLPHTSSNTLERPTHPPPVNPLSSSAALKASELTKSGSADRHPHAQHQPNIGLLKTKISSLSPETRQLVEGLLNIFSRTLPDKWTPPANLETIPLDDQIDITLDKLVEASEILFNKDGPSLLKKYGRDLRESPNRRADKWKSIINMLGSEDQQFRTAFLTSDALDSVVISALLKPLESDETEILADVLRLSIIHDISLKELIAVISASSKSNEHVKNKLDENRSLADAIVELVCSFRKLVRAVDEDFQVQDLKKDGAEVSESVNQSVSLLEHANTIKHAKGGNDIIHPLESFFQDQILEEIREGEKWQKTNQEAKEEKEAKLNDIDEFIGEEEGKLKNVQATITDLESKLEQKKAEEKILQVSLALKVKEREEYLKERERTEADIKAHIDKTAQQLDHHKKAEESVTKFSQDITTILDKEVSETLKKTKEVLHELEKEVTFLEEKLITYERSMSLFNNADEPEVLDGLRKLFTRSTAIYAESKLSVSRVSSVVELLRTVLGEDSSSVEELAVNLEKIVGRQNVLNNKYKLQKE